MRILIVSQWFDPEPGAVRGLPLARWLRQRGHDVCVLTGFPNYPGGRIYPGYRLRWRQWDTLGGIRVLRCPLFPSHNRSAVQRVANYGSFALSAAALGTVLAPAADAAFVYHPPGTIGFPAAALKWVRGVPFVYHVADMWPESVLESGMLGQGMSKRLVAGFLERWCKFVYGQAHSISVLSPGLKRLLVERGVSPGKISVIYNWAEEELFRPLPRNPELAGKLGFSGRFNVVYAGNLGIFQGLETVLRAAVLLRDNPAIQIVLAGTGQEEDKLRALAREQGADNVRFLGKLAYEDMPAVNGLADVLLVHLKDLPFFESTIPGKTQVSLASGRPVLMAVRGDAAEVIRDAHAGLICEPENPEALADAVRTFCRMDPEQREALGANGREFYVRQMGLEVGGRATESLLAAAARTRKGADASNR